MVHLTATGVYLLPASAEMLEADLQSDDEGKNRPDIESGRGQPAPLTAQ